MDLLLLSLLAGACARPAPPATSLESPAPEWRLARQAMRTACAAKRWDDCRAATVRALEATSGNSSLVYNLAAIDALRGDKEGALAGLRRYAALGQAHDAKADDDFASLLGEPRFAAVLELLERNRAPIGAPIEVARAPPAERLIEDVVRDPTSRAWYLSSIAGRQVLVLRDGAPARPLLAEGSGLYGMFALGLDTERHRLWATTAAVPQAPGLEASERGRSALLSISLEDGAVLQRFEAPGPGPKALGDLTVGPDGTVYVSDGLTGHLYRLPPRAAALEELAGPLDFLSPQTPALAPNFRVLYVPDYLRGIALVDLKSRAVRWLAHGEDLALDGIDGLYLRSPRELIAVQNGAEPVRVLRLRLDEAGERVLSSEVLARGAPVEDPTHGVLIGDDFVVLAHAGWSAVGEAGAPRPGAPVDPPRLLRLPLGPRE